MFSRKDSHVVIEISTGSMIRVLVFLVVLFFLYLIRDIIAIFIIAILLASVIEPAITWFYKRKIPRVVGVLFMYLVMFFAIISFIVLLVPPVISQIQNIAQNFPTYWAQIQGYLPQQIGGSSGTLAEIQKTLLNWSSSVAKTTTEGVFSSLLSLFGGVISFFVILVITYYFLVQEDPLQKVIKSVVPDQYQPYIIKLFSRMQQKISLWLRGQLILSLIIGSITFIALLILGVPNALVLALLAGLLEMIPILGPTIAAIPAILIAFSQSSLTAMLVLGAYIIIQQIENNLLVPKVMARAVGLNPIIVILAVLIGAKTAGFIGILLAIPILTALSVFVKDFMQKNNHS